MAKDLEVKLTGLAGDYMETAIVLEWHAAVGDAVEAGRPLVTVENAKAATEIEVPATGVLKEIRVEAGSEVPLETVLAVIGGEAGAAVTKIEMLAMSGMQDHYLRSRLRQLNRTADGSMGMDDMLRRHLNYASVLAAHDGRGGTIFRILVSPSAAFLKQLLLRRGFLDGWRGVLAAGGMAACALMKHLLLAQRRHFGPIGDTRSNA